MFGFMFAHKSGVTTFKSKIYRKQAQLQNTLLGPGCSSVLNSVMIYNGRLETLLLSFFFGIHSRLLIRLRTSKQETGIKKNWHFSPQSTVCLIERRLLALQAKKQLEGATCREKVGVVQGEEDARKRAHFSHARNTASSHALRRPHARLYFLT